MLAAARLAVPLVFHHSINTFQATRSENDTEFHWTSEGSGERGPASSPGQEAPSARPSCPAASRRLGRVTSRGVSGTYVTPRGRRCCCFSPSQRRTRFRDPPQLPQCPGTSQPSPPSLPSPGASRPAASLPAGGTRHCPSPAAGQRSPAPPPAGELLPPQAAPGSQHGRGRAAGVPAEKGSARKVSLSLPGQPRLEPIPGHPERGRTALLTRYTPLRPPPAPLAPRPRSYTPRRGTGSGTPPGGAGPPPSWAGRNSASTPRCPESRPERGGRARAADPDPRVAPRGRGTRQARDLPRGGFKEAECFCSLWTIAGLCSRPWL